MKQLSKNEKVAVGVGIVLIAALFLIFGMNNSNPLGSGDLEGLSLEDQGRELAPAGELVINDRLQGEGAVAESGDSVTVHYVGSLVDGTVFDSSVQRGDPFTFTLGEGQVIEGWERGVEGMRVGGVRQLIISPELAYGSQGSGPIPPNSTLIFEVELLEVEK